MKRNYKLERLLAGETFETSEKGNSMTPLLMSGETHLISPIKLEDCAVGDIVYCKIRGRFYTHLVKAVGERGLLIGNNHGHINGWTKAIFGKITLIKR